MTADELMIGNFVRVNKDVSIRKGTIVEIHAIDADRTFQKFGLQGCATCVPIDGPDWLSGGVWMDYLDPIPLTIEILEKNDFKLIAGVWYIQTKERKPVQICFKGNIITMSINCTPVPINLKYVHQLQNALKLYGIKRKIKV